MNFINHKPVFNLIYLYTIKKNTEQLFVLNNKIEIEKIINI